MDFSQDELQILVALGLTILQARVVFTLVEKGNSKVKEISKISKVSRPDVYRSLSKLQELGLVEKEISKPYKFRALPMEIILQILMSRRSALTKNLKTKANTLLNRLKTHQKINKYQEESHFILFPSKESLILRLNKAVQNTKISIDILTSSKRFKYACYCLADSLLDAWKRQVIGRAIIEKTQDRSIESTLEIWKNPWAEIQYISDVPRSIMAIYDKNEVFIFTKPDAELKDSPALWSNNPSLLSIVNNYFEGIWKKPYESIVSVH